MLIKISRQDCLKRWPKFPQKWFDNRKEEIESFYPTVFRSYVLIIQSKTFKRHAKQLGRELAELTKALEFDSLLFLGDSDTAWLYQDSDYKPVSEALQFLKDKKINKKFNGALQVTPESLPIFITHLSWLSRCNAALPYFYFSNKEQTVLGTICQYGNIHFDTLNELVEMRFHSILPQTNFMLLGDKICSEQFSTSGAIKGRRIITG
ncbi:MAG TPA: hypothetical protein VF476_15455 [Chitinophagaceae bacterium]